MDAKTKIAEIEQKRAERKAALAAAREEQLANDLEALDALEQEHGDHAIARLDVDGFKPGHTAFVALRSPSSIEYQRFCDMIARAGNDAKKKLEAQNMLAESCWCYPKEKDARKAMLEAYPGMLLSVAVRAMKLAEATEAAEGKG